MRTLISLIVPAFNEADNLVPLYEAVTEAFERQDFDWEMILVDDHSGDRTPDVIGEIAKKDQRVRGVRLSRNMGSHIAMRCGISFAHGNLVGVIAADLQDQPDIIVSMVAELRQTGANVVWAVRERREGTSLSDRLFSRFFHTMMSRIMDLKNIPAMGADVVLFDRRVADALHGLRETHANMFALIQWAGFRQTYMTYVKLPRRHGLSAYSHHVACRYHHRICGIRLRYWRVCQLLPGRPRARLEFADDGGVVRQRNQPGRDGGVGGVRLARARRNSRTLPFPDRVGVWSIIE
jgi:polyisoprenyl-phosphate glycosyltransferase